MPANLRISQSEIHGFVMVCVGLRAGTILGPKRVQITSTLARTKHFMDRLRKIVVVRPGAPSSFLLLGVDKQQINQGHNIDPQHAPHIFDDVLGGPIPTAFPPTAFRGSSILFCLLGTVRAPKPIPRRRRRRVPYISPSETQHIGIS